MSQEKPDFELLKGMPARKDGHHPAIIGHRGAAGLAPENTLAGFELAVESGVDGIEFDVQRSADGHLVVCHDENLERTTNGEGPVRALNLAALQKLDAGNWFDPRFGGQKIPRLVEVFDLLCDDDVILHLELKSPWLYPEIERSTAKLVREWGLVERVQIRSFYHPVLRQLHEIAPEIAISELWFDHLPAGEETVFKTINGRWSLYTPDSLAEIHVRGQEATAWTVNDIEIAHALIEMGIDGLTTDYPDRLLPLVCKE